MKNTKKEGSKAKVVRKVTQTWLFRNIIIATAILVLIIITATISLNSYTRHGERFDVPDYRGMTVEDAQALRPEMNIAFDVTDSIYTMSVAPGVILDQYPKPGNFVKSGRRITLTINTIEPKNVKIPYVTGYSLRQAKNRLVSAGLKINKIVYEPDIATNNVLRQLYNGQIITASSDTTVPVGSGVTLVVGITESASSIVRIEDFVGMSFYEVRNQLWEDGLNFKLEYDRSQINDVNIDKSIVYSQSPMPGDTVLYGGDVRLKLTVDSTVVRQGRAFMRNKIKQLDSLSNLRNIFNDSLKMVLSNEHDILYDEVTRFNLLLMQLEEEIINTKKI